MTSSGCPGARCGPSIFCLKQQECKSKFQLWPCGSFLKREAPHSSSLIRHIPSSIFATQEVPATIPVMLMAMMAKLEKYLFPGFLFFFEVVFLVVFGLLVKYDERRAPDAELAAAQRFALDNGGSSAGFIRKLESTLSTTKVYPCEFVHCHLTCSYISTVFACCNWQPE